MFRQITKQSTISLSNKAKRNYNNFSTKVHEKYRDIRRARLLYHYIHLNDLRSYEM